MRKLFPLALLLLAGCSSMPSAESNVPASDDPNSPAAQKEMCVEENIGVLRFSRGYLEEFCPQLKTQFELTCFRFLHATKEWRKACPGVDTMDKLECISTIQNGPSYALLESLQKCKQVKNRKQVLCLSRAVSKSGVPLQPETVQGCLDKNAG
jgi:hypothetical protein